MYSSVVCRFTLPAAAAIGEFVIDTSDPDFDCSPFYGYRNKSIITGYYECQGSTFPIVTSSAYGLFVNNDLIVGVGILGMVMMVL
jgi:hypothetical protein